jgi:hypothetical protein
MKRYKFERKQEAHKKKHPTKFKRQNELLKATRTLALNRFKNEYQQYIYWYGGDCSPKDIFGMELIRETELKLTYSDIEVCYPVFQKCLKKLEKDKEKADFLKKAFKPLEEDLFNIS